MNSFFKQTDGESTEEIESSEQFEFVQFHPNYDYTDFVEGIRPIINNGDILITDS